MMTTNKIDSGRAHNGARKGGVLVSVVVVMLIMGVLGVSLVSFNRTSTHSYLSANSGSRAYYLAESGLRYAQKVYCDEGWLHGRKRTLSLQAGDQVDVIRLGDTFWATAVVDIGTAKEGRARVPMALSACGTNPPENPRPVLIDEFAVFGDVGIALGKNTLIEGDVAITNDDVAIRGDVDGSVLARNVVLTGQGSVTGIEVSGGIYSSGTVDIISGTVSGDIQSANGISVRSTRSIVKGWLFSNGAIDLGGGSTVLGHVHSCGADVTIGGNNTVIGTAGTPIEIRTTGNVYISGSARVTGIVYAGGDIEISGSARIIGDAYAGGTISKESNMITGTALQNSPTYLEQPICPYLANLEGLVLPDASEFTAGGDDVNIPGGSSDSPSKRYLTPGTYGHVDSPNNPQGYTSLFLNAGTTGHGIYYLDSATFGSKTALHLNLSGTYDIRVFVVGDVDIGSSLETFVSTDGTNYLPISDVAVDPELAARVYWEPHGDFDLQSGAKWFGSVYTPFGNLSIGNSGQLFGSYYSGDGHDIIASTIVHVPPNYFSEQ